MQHSGLWIIASECYLLTSEIRRQRAFFGSAVEAESHSFLSKRKTPRALGVLKKPLPGLVSSNVVMIESKRAPMIRNKRACRFRQALLFELGVVVRRSLLRLHDHKGAASVEETNAQHNFLLV